MNLLPDDMRVVVVCVGVGLAIAAIAVWDRIDKRRGW